MSRLQEDKQQPIAAAGVGREAREKEVGDASFNPEYGKGLVAEAQAQARLDRSPVPRSQQIVTDALKRASESGVELSIYLPQGATKTSLPNELNDLTTVNGIEQYLRLGIPIDNVYVNSSSFQGGFYTGAEGRLERVRSTLDEAGYPEAKVSPWVESATSQLRTSTEVERFRSAVYFEYEGEVVVDVLNESYFAHYLQNIERLASSPHSDRVTLDDESFGILVPEEWAARNPGVPPSELTRRVMRNFSRIIETIESHGKESFYSVNGRFTSSRITEQGLDVYGMIDAGLDGLEVQAYRPTVEGFQLLLEGIRSDLRERPETIRKLGSFHLALSIEADGTPLSPETRAQQLALATRFLNEVKREFGIQSVGIALWPQAYRNYVTGESLRHPTDR